MSQPNQAIAIRSPWAIVFLLHIACEIPIAVQGVWSPHSLPFLQLNNTTLVILKLYSSLMLATCLAALLCFSLPDFLPGKRAFAIALCLYHTIASTVLMQSPRFIPYSFGPLFESYKFTPEKAWGSAHGITSLLLVVWWQNTIQITSAMGRKRQH